VFWFSGFLVFWYFWFCGLICAWCFPFRGSRGSEGFCGAALTLEALPFNLAQVSEGLGFFILEKSQKGSWFFYPSLCNS